MFDINEVPYAEWLEKSLQAIVPLKPVCLCFAATMPDGEVYTGYYNADATDKAVIAHNIQADITMDIIRTNAATIKDMIEHCEEDACRDGLGECAVLVEGTAFADLWLDVHSTLRIYESGERTVELKGTAKSA